jgi:hypothetical protein
MISPRRGVRAAFTGGDCCLNAIFDDLVLYLCDFVFTEAKSVVSIVELFDARIHRLER